MPKATRITTILAAAAAATLAAGSGLLAIVTRMAGLVALGAIAYGVANVFGIGWACIVAGGLVWTDATLETIRRPRP